MIRTFKICSLSNFQIYNKALLAIVTMLDVTTSGLIYLITGSLYFLLVTISEAAIEAGLIRNWIPTCESSLAMVF